ncbi:MAG: hypothetical protein KIPDCIKN_00798 [Haliscomenobacter sp.]|jgi:invasion protein IalB|nr:hypothetical protein [Haliscomenobacter sp.]
MNNKINKPKIVPIMLNRILKFGILAAFSALFVFTSCEKEEEVLVEDFGPTDETLFNGRGPETRGLRGPGDRCFELVFPVIVEFPNGNTTEVANKAAYAEVIKTWRQANPKAKQHPKIAFPYEVMLKDGTLATIESLEDLKDILEDCLPNRRPHLKACYDLVFPVTIKFPDSTTAVANSGEEFKDLLQSWRDANPDAEGHPVIVFPYDVELPDGTTVTVESLADVRELIHACKEKRTHFPPCFHIVYPVTVVFPGGSELEVADREAFLKAVREWRSNNPDVEDRPTIKFPYEVMLRDGSTATVNNEEELKALIQDCKPAPKCFVLQFPAPVKLPNGTVVVANSAQELDRIMHQWKKEHRFSRELPHVAFPHKVKLQDGTVVTVNSKEELEQIIKTCRG